MYFRLLIVPVVFLFAGGQSDDAAKKDLKQLQGDWELHAMEVNAQLVPVQKLQNTVLTIKDDLYIVKIKGKVINTVRIKLDAGKDPRQIDMTYLEGDTKGQVGKGIYKIEGDTWKMCRGLAPDQERPRELGSWPGTNYFVVTWKRLTSQK